MNFFSQPTAHRLQQFGESFIAKILKQILFGEVSCCFRLTSNYSTNPEKYYSSLFSSFCSFLGFIFLWGGGGGLEGCFSSRLCLYHSQNGSVECNREVCPKIDSCTGVISKKENQCCEVCDVNRGNLNYRHPKNA